MGKKSVCLFLCVIFANTIESSHIRRKHQAIHFFDDDLPDNNLMVINDPDEDFEGRDMEPVNADPIAQVCYGFTHSDVVLPLPSYCKVQAQYKKINEPLGWQKPIHCRPPYINCVPGEDSDTDSSDNNGTDNNGSENNGSNNNGSDNNGLNNNGSDNNGSNNNGSDNSGSNNNGSDHNGSDNNGSDNHGSDNGTHNNNSTVVTSTMKPLSPNKTKECIHICKLMTPEYNPVCGTDGVTYVNPGHLICAITCGIDVDYASMGVCGNDNNSATSKPPKPTSVVPPTSPRPTKPTSVVPPTPSTTVSPTTLKPPTPSTTVPPTTSKPPKPTSVVPPTPSTIVPPTPSTIVPPTPSTIVPPTPSTIVPPTPSTIVPPTPSTIVPPTPSTIVPPTPSTIVPPTPSTIVPTTSQRPTPSTTTHGGNIIFPDHDDDEWTPTPRPPKPTTVVPPTPSTIVPPTTLKPPTPTTIVAPTTSKLPKPTSVVPPTPSTIVPPTTLKPPTPSTIVPPTTSKPPKPTSVVPPTPSTTVLPTPSTIVPPTLSTIVPTTSQRPTPSTTTHGGNIIFPDHDDDEWTPTPRPPKPPTTAPPRPTTSSTTVRPTTMTSTTSTTTTTVKPITTTMSAETFEECVRHCRHATSKYNPVCGTDGVTYINPLHLVCVKYCGVNVGFASVGPCGSESSTLEPAKDEDTTTPCPSPKPQTVEQCVRDCNSIITKENPVCGSDGVTYINPLHLVCVKYCGVDVTFASKGPCNGGSVTVSPPTPPSTTTKPGPLPDKVVECIKSCPLTAEYNPVCGTDGQTYSNPGRLICARQCGAEVDLLYRGPCRITSSTTSTTTTDSSSISTTSTASPLPDKIVECIKSCPVTAEFNPVCGTNGMTYANPGRLICARECGVDVDMLYRGPCRASTTSSTTVVTPTTTTVPTTSSLTPEALKQCMTKCKSTPEYNPVCGTNGVTFPNMGTLTCAQRCGLDVKFAKYGKCSSPKPRQKRENIAENHESPEPSEELSSVGLNCKETCLATKEFEPVCGSDYITYANPSVLRCEQLCGKNVTEMRQDYCDPSMTTTVSTPIFEIPEAV